MIFMAEQKKKIELKNKNMDCWDDRNVWPGNFKTIKKIILNY